MRVALPLGPMVADHDQRKPLWPRFDPIVHFIPLNPEKTTMSMYDHEALREPKPADQTLRNAVMGLVRKYETGFDDPADTVNAIATLLEETGAPAYCRVATDLRGEWVG